MNIILHEEKIVSRIYHIRGEKVMLDYDLAQLYDVTTTRLNEQAKRNIKRFPQDFMFQLTIDEYKRLMSQIATSNTVDEKQGRGGRRKLPMAFTEHGAIMLSAVLNSETAIEASVAIVRAFVRLRQLIQNNKQLEKKIEELEKLTNERLDNHDDKLTMLFNAIKKLIEQKAKPRKEIGYKANQK